MKLLALSLNNFRSLQGVSWSPGDLNVVIGPNGSGKSNLLRALEFVAAMAQGRLESLVQSQGGLDALLWDGRGPSLGMSLVLEMEAPPQAAALSPEPLWSRVTAGGPPPRFLAFRLDRGRKGTLYRFASETLFLMSVEAPPVAPNLRSTVHYVTNGVLLERDARTSQVRTDKGALLDAADLSEGESLLSQMRGPFIANHQISVVREGLEGIMVHHDMRVDQQAPLRAAAVARHEPRLAADGQNLINVLHTLYSGDRDFKRDIDDAMRAAFGPEFEELLFPPAADQRVQLRVRWRSLRREVSAADLSDGTLRFLLLLTALRAPDPPPLLAIDEPEIGLHPRMLPIIAEHAVDAASRTQVILTTHSPQFLDAFRGTRPTTTVARSVAGCTQLKVVDDEALRYWLKEYTLGALFRSGELEDME